MLNCVKVTRITLLFWDIESNPHEALVTSVLESSVVSPLIARTGSKYIGLNVIS